MRFFSTFLREPVFGPFYHTNSFRHSRQAYLVHSGWQNEGQKVIIKITDCMFFNLLMGTWFSMQRQEGGGVAGGGALARKNVIMSFQQIKALQALHHIPPLHLHQASFITLSKKTVFYMCPFTFFARFQEHLWNLFQVIERIWLESLWQCSKGGNSKNS